MGLDQTLYYFEGDVEDFLKKLNDKGKEFMKLFCRGEIQDIVIEEENMCRWRSNYELFDNISKYVKLNKHLRYKGTVNEYYEQYDEGIRWVVLNEEKAFQIYRENFRQEIFKPFVKNKCYLFVQSY
jgi:hypothetical protein